MSPQLYRSASPHNSSASAAALLECFHCVEGAGREREIESFLYYFYYYFCGEHTLKEGEREESCPSGQSVTAAFEAALQSAAAARVTDPGRAPAGVVRAADRGPGPGAARSARGAAAEVAAAVPGP